jgi:hypothetical protein
LDKHGVFSCENEESVRGPAAHELNESSSDAMLSKGGGAAGSHGLATDINVKVVVYFGDEKVSGEDITLRC